MHRHILIRLLLDLPTWLTLKRGDICREELFERALGIWRLSEPGVVKWVNGYSPNQRFMTSHLPQTAGVKKFSWEITPSGDQANNSNKKCLICIFGSSVADGSSPHKVCAGMKLCCQPPEWSAADIPGKDHRPWAQGRPTLPPGLARG